MWCKRYDNILIRKTSQRKKNISWKFTRNQNINKRGVNRIIRIVQHKNDEKSLRSSMKKGWDYERNGKLQEIEYYYW